MNLHEPSTVALSVCLINHNGERYLHETLKSIHEIRAEFGEIIIVDNASEDRSLELFEDYFPAGKVIRLEENLGPAVARNAGFSQASYSRVLFLDNDVRLNKYCIDRLTHALDENTRATVAIPRVFYNSNEGLIQYDGAECHFIGLMALHNVDEPASSASQAIRPVGSLATTCFLMDRQLWSFGPPFDESFFFNYEDHDFGVRLRCLGQEILSVPTAHCYHGEGTLGLSIRPGRSYSSTRVYCLIRNRWQIIIKNYQLRTLVVLAPALLVYEVCQLIGLSGKGWFREWWRALVWMTRNFRVVLGKRRFVQGARTTQDVEILQDCPLPFRSEFANSAIERQAIRILDRSLAAYWWFAKRLLAA